MFDESVPWKQLVRQVAGAFRSTHTHTHTHRETHTHTNTYIHARWFIMYAYFWREVRQTRERCLCVIGRWCSTSVISTIWHSARQPWTVIERNYQIVIREFSIVNWFLTQKTYRSRMMHLCLTVSCIHRFLSSHLLATNTDSEQGNRKNTMTWSTVRLFFIEDNSHLSWANERLPVQDLVELWWPIFRRELLASEAGTNRVGEWCCICTRSPASFVLRAGKQRLRFWGVDVAVLAWVRSPRWHHAPRVYLYLCLK